MDLKELESGVDPKIHWYYQSKKIPLVAFVKKIFAQKKVPLTLVDVGSGSGFFMYELYEKIPQMISKIYLVDIGYTESETAATSNQVIEKIKSLPDEMENAIVVMMDVLEHLDDDHAMLQAIREKSKGTNHYFITVPAFMDLWSGHDVYLGHYRRYTRKSLSALLDHSSYQKDKIYYIYGLIFPMVWMARKLTGKKDQPESDMKPMSPLVNGLLKSVCSLEMAIGKMNTVAGVSVVGEGSFHK
jgi:hypothetical protein